MKNMAPLPSHRQICLQTFTARGEDKTLGKKLFDFPLHLSSLHVRLGNSSTNFHRDQQNLKKITWKNLKEKKKKKKHHIKPAHFDWSVILNSTKVLVNERGSRPTLLRKWKDLAAQANFVQQGTFPQKKLMPQKHNPKLSCYFETDPKWLSMGTGCSITPSV